MLDRKEFVKEYEALIAKKVNAEEEYAQLRDSIGQAKRDLAALVKQKEEYAQFQIDHQKALLEIDTATQVSKTEVKAQAEHMAENLKKQENDINVKDAALVEREKDISKKEKRLHQLELDLKSRERNVIGREVLADERMNEVSGIAQANTKKESELTVKETSVNQQIRYFETLCAQNSADKKDNAETVKIIQNENARLVKREEEAKKQENEVAQKLVDIAKWTDEISASKDDLAMREAALASNEEKLDSKRKDLEDKERNLLAEKEDLDFARANLNSDIEKAKKKGIVK